MILYADGGTIGEVNPSPNGVYWSFGVETPDGFRVEGHDESPAHTTNNEAEYLALIAALQYAFRVYSDHSIGFHGVLIIRMDSQLIVNQFMGRWRVKEIRLLQLYKVACALSEKLELHGIPVTVEWVSRDELVTRVGH